MTFSEFLQKAFMAIIYCLTNGAGNEGGVALAVLSWIILVSGLMRLMTVIAKFVRSVKR